MLGADDSDLDSRQSPALSFPPCSYPRRSDPFLSAIQNRGLLLAARFLKKYLYTDDTNIETCNTNATKAEVLELRR